MMRDQLEGIDEINSESIKKGADYGGRKKRNRKRREVCFLGDHMVNVFICIYKIGSNLRQRKSRRAQMIWNIRDRS